MAGKINKRSDYIEEAGIFFESAGMTRMAGRIFGYLAVTDKEDVSFDELTQVLYASKSSISTNVKAMVQLGFIKPLTHGGDRKTYYCLTPEMDWGGYFLNRMKGMESFKKIMKKAYELRVNKNDRTSEWIKDSIEFYDWLSAKIPELVEEWRKMKQSGN